MIYVAFGQHVDFAHSYRGDTPTDDGFGLDIDVITRTLDVLDEYPWARCDWDIECARALDDLMPRYAGEMLDRIRTRVAEGRDSVRHMSWGGEILSALTPDEFAESIARSRSSLQSAFGAEHVDEGMYSQEMMYSPDMPRLLTDAGVEWLSLFYGATPFTAFRRDVHLEGSEPYNPLRLFTPERDASIVAMPAYQHADLLDFDGLDGWCRALHERFGATDCLVHVAFDADGASWPGVLASSLPAIADLDFVECTLASAYVRSHPPVRDVVVHRDLADGAMDGYGNWAEKPINHRLFTAIQAGRRNGAPIEQRLRAMKTTNFGLAAPHLHPGRVQSVERFIAAFGDGVGGEGDAPDVPALDAGVPALAIGRLEPYAGARFSEPAVADDGGVSFWVEVTFPDDYDADDAEPCPIVLDWSPPITVEKTNFRGYESTCEILEDQDSINNHLTPGGIVLRENSAGGNGAAIHIAFDERVRAGVAAVPLRVRDGELRINPFGTYWGEFPDLHPEWTGARGVGHMVTRQFGEHIQPSGPAFAGATLRFRLTVTRL